MGWHVWWVEHLLLYTYGREWTRELTHIHGWRQHSQTHQNQTQREIENINREWSNYIYKIESLHGQTSIISKGRLKPIIKPLDSGWNYIMDLSFKLISLLVIWLYNCNNEVKKNITHLGTLIVRVCRSTLNIFPQWISKPRIIKPKNHRKSSSSVGRFAKNLNACKKSQYDVQNYKYWRHNWRHTFKCCTSQYKPISTNIPYNGLMVKLS